MFWKLMLVSRRHKVKLLDRNAKLPRRYITNRACKGMWLFWAALSAQPICSAQHIHRWCKGYIHLVQVQCGLGWQQCHCTATVPCWQDGPHEDTEAFLHRWEPHSLKTGQKGRAGVQLSSPFVDPAMIFVPVTLVDLAFPFMKRANKL